MRIIAGKHKGRVLNSPKTEDIRPTLDMVKQALFTKFQFDIVGASFLDLFGGSGAIGIEAISRGAKDVTIIDNDATSISLIKKNLSIIKEESKVILQDYKNYLRTTNERFNFIFIDPPYGHKKAYESAIKIIAERKLLKDDGWCICEHPFDSNILSEKLKLVEQKKYGTVCLSFFK